MKFNIPEEILYIAEKLKKSDFQAYLVGGCVRDLLMGREPKDWDVATNAKPEEIQKIFPDSVYENKFGTVAIKIKKSKFKNQNNNSKFKNNLSQNLTEIVEVTTFRLEGKYTDKRHPDDIKFAKTIEEDLARRDFTINAMAIKIKNQKSKIKTTNQNSKVLDYEIIDIYGGQNDIKNKIIRAVGEPEKRFNEDALRLMRAVRFATELGFTIEEKTAAAISVLVGFLEVIAKERICDELVKILMTPKAKEGIQILEDNGLLRHIMPEIREGIDVGQNKHHIYSVWEHNLRALDYAAKKNYSLEIRMASLLHDVGKPRAKAGEGPDCTFYAHEMIGAKMTAKILENLRFSKDFIERVSHLVRCHLFYYNVGEVTEAGVRRFLRRVGPENVDDLIKIREADRIGSGVPKAVPYKLRHLLFMIEKVKRDPISPKMLKVKGDEVMKILNISPGPKIGQILSILLDEVIEEPKKNMKENLELIIGELGKLSDIELKKLSQTARERKEEFEAGLEEEVKKKYYVK